MKKNFLTGFLTGALIFGSVTSFAMMSYQAYVADFNVMLNGEKWTCDKPIVTIEGSTYLPLKALGDALNVNVNWNNDLRQVEIGDTPNLTEKYSRKNPAPMGTTQTVKVSNILEDYTASVTVEETLRGEKAWKVIKDSWEYNTALDDDYEYILAKVRVNMDSVKEDKAIDINQYSFSCYSTNNVKYDDWVIIVCDDVISTSLYEGGSITGYVPFKVKKSDVAPKFVFGERYDGTGGIWFSL